MSLFYIFVYSLYGTVSPIAVYEGVISPERTEAFRHLLLSIPLRARVDALLDYFLAQRDGLLLSSPLYFFSFLGMVESCRRKRRDFWALVFIGLPFLLNYALFTHRQGNAPQGRVLTPLSWILIIAVGHFIFHNRRQAFSFLFGTAAAAGFLTAALLFLTPPSSTSRQPTRSRPGRESFSSTSATCISSCLPICRRSLKSTIPAICPIVSGLSRSCPSSRPIHSPEKRGRWAGRSPLSLPMGCSPPHFSSGCSFPAVRSIPSRPSSTRPSWRSDSLLFLWEKGSLPRRAGTSISTSKNRTGSYSGPGENWRG